MTDGTATSVLNQRDYAVNEDHVPAWITPELINESISDGSGAKDDVWALGCITHELFSSQGQQRTPFSSLMQLADEDEKHYDCTEGE